MIVLFLVSIVVAALVELVPPFAFRSILDTAIPHKDRTLITVLAEMETNGILVEPGDKPGTLTCWISHQAPHTAHGALAADSLARAPQVSDRQLPLRRRAGLEARRAREVQLREPTDGQLADELEPAELWSNPHAAPENTAKP